MGLVEGGERLRGQWDWPLAEELGEVPMGKSLL